MSGGFTVLPQTCGGQSHGANLTNSYAMTSIPASGTLNTFGAWTQLGTSNTAYDTTHMALQVIGYQNSVNCAGATLSFGIGPSGSQQTYIANIQCAFSSANASVGGICGYNLLLPVSIPANTALWARAAYACTSAAAIETSVITFNSDYYGAEIAGYDCLGFANNGYGTALVANAGVYGAWASVISSTAEDYCGFFCIIDTGQVINSPGSLEYAFNIGIGTSGNQKIILPNFLGSLTDNYVINFQNPVFFPIPIPKGTNIWAQGTNLTSGASGANAIGVTIYGAKI